jgi:hypothetical protein
LLLINFLIAQIAMSRKNRFARAMKMFLQKWYIAFS